MALSGTLETFSLPDVLRLLSSTRKTGLLALDGDRGAGRVWVDSGDIVAAEADRSVVDDVDAVLFELLRFADAAFEFDASAEPPTGDVRREVEPALDVASARLEEWREIEAVVPSLDVRVRMVPEIDGEVAVAADVWRILARVGTGTSGHELAAHLGEGEYEVCRSLRDLVEGGLVEVTEVEAPVVEAVVADAFEAMVHAPAAPETVYEVPEVPEVPEAAVEAIPAWEPEAPAAEVAPNEADDDTEVDEDVAPEAEVADDDAGAAPVDASPWAIAEAELRAQAPGSDDLAGDLALLSPKAAAAVQATWGQDATDAADDAAEATAEGDGTEQSGGDDLDQNLLLRFLSSAKH